MRESLKSPCGRSRKSAIARMHAAQRPRNQYSTTSIEPANRSNAALGCNENRVCAPDSRAQATFASRLRGGSGTVNERSGTTTGASLAPFRVAQAHAVPARPPDQRWATSLAADPFPGVATVRTAVVGIESLAVEIVRPALGFFGAGRQMSAAGHFLPRYRRSGGLVVVIVTHAAAEQSGEPHTEPFPKVAASLRRGLSLLRKDLNQRFVEGMPWIARSVKQLTQNTATRSQVSNDLP